jgi:iron complex transport system substrate-binding protein
VITIGAGSYLDELVEAAGGRSIFHELDTASPQVALEEVVRRDPTFVLAGPTGAERLRTSPAWQAVRAVREGRILVVDTALVAKPGVRMGEAAVHLRALLASGAIAR